MKTPGKPCASCPWRRAAGAADIPNFPYPSPNTKKTLKSGRDETSYPASVGSRQHPNYSSLRCHQLPQRVPTRLSENGTPNTGSLANSDAIPRGGIGEQWLTLYQPILTTRSSPVTPPSEFEVSRNLSSTS